MGKGFKSYKLIFSSDTTGAVEQLGELEGALGKANYKYSQLKNDLLKGGYNPTKFKQAQTECQKAVQASSDKLQILMNRLKEMEENGKTTGKYAKPYKALTEEIEKAKNAAERAENQLKQLNQIKFDSIKKSVKDISENLTKIGKGMTTYATLPLVAAGAAAVNMASDMEESANKVEVCFGDAAQSIMTFSETTLNTYGIAKSTALEMASLFGDMATSMGYSKQDAAEMSKTLVGLAGDLASFKNISLEEAQTALSGVFTGETESLKKLGIVMSDVSLQAYALANGINKKTSEMEQAEKVALRYQFVLDSTQNAQGDFSRTSDGTANQLRILSESLKELAAIAGEELIPIVTPIIQQINGMLQSLGNLDEGTKKLITKITIFIATLGPCLTLTGKLAGGVGSLITSYHSLKAAQAAASAGQTTLNSVMKANVYTGVATAIANLVAVLGSLIITNALTEESIDDIIESYNSTADSIDDNVKKQEAELAIVEKLIPRYEELNNKTNKTFAEKKELANIVGQINNILPDSIKLINAEKGAYEGVTSAIYETIEAKKQEIKIAAYREKAIAAQKAQIELLDEAGVSSIEEVEKLIVPPIDTSNMNWFEKFLLDFASDYNSVDTKFVKIKEKYYQLQEEIDRYTSAMGSNNAPNNKNSNSTSNYLQDKITTSSTNTSSTNTSSTNDPFKYQYQLNKDWLSLDLISEKKYYDNLEKLYKTYYKKNSEEYRKYQIEVYKGRQKLAQEAEEEQKQNQDDSFKYQYQLNKDWLSLDLISEKKYYDNLEKLYKTYYKKNSEEYRKYQIEVYEGRNKLAQEAVEAQKQLQEEMLADFEEYSDKIISLSEQEANAKIAAIDAELAARDKLKESEKQELKLQQAIAQLAFTTDAESRKSLEKEIKRLKEEIAYDEATAAAETKKAEIQAQLEQIKSHSSQLISNMTNQINPSDVNPYLNQINTSNIINANGLSVAQVKQMLEDIYNKILYNI